MCVCVLKRLKGQVPAVRDLVLLHSLYLPFSSIDYLQKETGLRRQLLNNGPAFTFNRKEMTNICLLLGRAVEFGQKYSHATIKEKNTVMIMIKFHQHLDYK